MHTCGIIKEVFNITQALSNMRSANTYFPRNECAVKANKAM